MNKKVVLDLDNHVVYYIKLDNVSYYLTVPKHNEETSISLELKSKMDNYNLDMNDELWVMENVKNTFSYIDSYNITLVLPILDSEKISILEKIDFAVLSSSFNSIFAASIEGLISLLISLIFFQNLSTSSLIKPSSIFLCS